MTNIDDVIAELHKFKKHAEIDLIQRNRVDKTFRIVHKTGFVQEIHQCNLNGNDIRFSHSELVIHMNDREVKDIALQIAGELYTIAHPPA